MHLQLIPGQEKQNIYVQVKVTKPQVPLRTSGPVEPVPLLAISGNARTRQVWKKVYCKKSGSLFLQIFAIFLLQLHHEILTTQSFYSHQPSCWTTSWLASSVHPASAGGEPANLRRAHKIKEQSISPR